MEERTFATTPRSLTKALLFGHLSNIIVGFMVFAATHWLLMIPTEQSVIATIITTAFMSIFISWLATKKLSAPFTALNQELHDLHQKVTSSTTALEKANEDAAALLENLPIGFLVFDQKTQLKTGNQRALSLFSNSEEAATGEVILEQLKTLRSNGAGLNFIDWLHQARSSKIQVTKRWPLVEFQTNEAVVICDLIAHYNKSDSHNNDLTLLLVDRTEEYAHQERQMEFIALAAHELRGPITIMRGLVDILDDEVGKTLSQEHKQLITRIIVSARQLAGYVDNILGVSRIDKDSFQVKPREADWAKVLAQTTQDLSIRAEAHHRKLEVRVAENLPTVAVDPSTIVHVISNLVDNAVKYSKENGTIVVSATMKDNMIETTVQDFGIGMPGNVVGNLFTRFYRSHRSKQIVSGTGLGLYLCKAITEAHGGNIWVRSSEGVGTTFGFTLPTYAAVADRVKAGNNNEQGIVRSTHGWIKNHALYRQ